MIITKHGYKRIKERLGLPKRAHLRHIKGVLENGSLLTAKNSKEFKIIYQGFLYIFSTSSKLEPVLITAYRQPVNYDFLVEYSMYHEI